MILVTFGSDTYGRVKKVATTSIITKFGMVQFAPVVPLESFFYARRGISNSDLISLVFGVEATTARAIPLARIDKFSVAMAYFRGFCGALTIVGCMSLVPAVMHFSGERLDQVAIMFTQALVACLIVGTLSGVLSYCLPGQVGSRQKRIRGACGEVLGIYADPAMFRRDIAKAMETFIRSGVAHDKLRADARSGGADKTLEARLELVLTRLHIALDARDQGLEQRSDELIESIRLASQHGA